MYVYLLAITSGVCIFFAGVCAKECENGVVAARETFHVPEGSSLSMSCVVEHCGNTWDGFWMWTNLTYEPLIRVNNTARHRLTRVDISANETKLVLEILPVNRIDAGDYRCSVNWDGRLTDQGHWKSVNVTAAVLSRRIFLHRVYVWIGSFLCLPIILGLARCLSSGVKPQLLPTAPVIYAAVNPERTHPAPRPPPRRSVQPKRNASSQKAPPKGNQKTEVVYADISQHALRNQGATRKPAESTVYSAVRFT
ncbi:uncharacterized protein si:dkey-52l18.4 [Mugil cephalus]|uniref:uncharacterized protein si:dkey-52l18.4 n=1 Tax=Mugil cephalus TaxID=48193 RepID=UPI001FB662D4|nr:uncharacterized protein si:dkey-52l18.4 [Mugil cephalus]